MTMNKDTGRDHATCRFPRAALLHATILFATLTWSPLQAQNPPAAPSAAGAQETYAKLCAGCHGADAHGSQQGPGLAGNPGVRRRSVQNLRNVIMVSAPSSQLEFGKRTEQVQ
jgi:mono/diheme cytochrome c family protein